MPKLVLFFLLSVMGTGGALADVYNPNTLPIGEKEAFNANSGTASIDSSGSVYYNPGALVTVKKNKMSLSGSTYLTFNYSIDVLMNTDSTDLAFKNSGFMSIPTSFISIFKKWDWTFAFSILQPDGITLETRASWTTPNNRINIVSEQSSSEIWAGFSASKWLTEKLSLGATLTGVRRTELIVQTTIFDILNVPNTTVTVAQRTQKTVYGMLLNLGSFYDLGDGWHLGGRMRTPFVQLNGTTEYFSQTRAVINGTLSSSGHDRYNVNTSHQMPWDFGLATTYSNNGRWVYQFDLGYQLGVNYRTSDDNLVAKQISTEPTLRESFGVEFKYSPNLSFLAGAGYTPSSVHTLSGRPDGTSREDHYMGTFGVDMGGENSSTGLGAFFLWAEGQQKLDGTNGRIVRYTLNAMGVMLNSSYHF